METIYVIIGVLVLLNVRVIALYLHVGKRLPSDEREDDERQYYDENGNHVYYDRKLIARLKREKEKREHQGNNNDH